MKKIIAEVFGTFCLIFIGCSAIVIGGLGGALPLGMVGIGLAFGLTVTAMAYAIGPVSGAHLNPAVTAGFVTSGRMESSEAIGYIVGQMIGAFLGALALYIILQGHASGLSGMGQNGWDGANGFAMWSAFLVEVIATFLFVTVILNVTSEKHSTILAGLVIGLTLFILHLAFIPASGNSLNPARSFGPAVFAGATALGQLWLYIVAPMIGGAVAGIVHKGKHLLADDD
ncbi:MAG: MIP/aquaporin family protein [Hyphomicrobiaceae bacterium]